MLLVAWLDIISGKNWHTFPATLLSTRAQGCQMVSFQTKNSNFGIFWRILEWIMLLYIPVIWNILRPLGIFYGHLVHLLVIWFIFPVLVLCTN
jgi:hypothetical protein